MSERFVSRDEDSVVIDTVEGIEYPIMEGENTAICELLNELHTEAVSKPLDLHKDFEEYETRLCWLNKTNRRIDELEEFYSIESERILAEARELKINFKAIYGLNNKDVRQKYADSQMPDILTELKELKFLQSEDYRRVEFLKLLIRMKIKLIGYDGDIKIESPV